MQVKFFQDNFKIDHLREHFHLFLINTKNSLQIVVISVINAILNRVNQIHGA